MITQDLINEHAELWQLATHHSFVEGIRSGSIPKKVFDSWLTQLYHFVKAFARTQARIIAQAPLEDVRILVDGLKAVMAELDWFENKAQEREISFDVPLGPVVRAHIDFLLALTYETYPHQIVVLWAIERIYLEAWKSTLSGSSTYRDFTEHWTTYDDYAQALEAAANRAMAGTNESVSDDFNWAVKYMIKFWEMGYEKEALLSSAA
jgi:thiaminase/transcriptional activator TenA